MTCCRRFLIGLAGPKARPDKRPERGALDIEQVLDAEYTFLYDT